MSGPQHHDLVTPRARTRRPRPEPPAATARERLVAGLREALEVPPDGTAADARAREWIREMLRDDGVR